MAWQLYISSTPKPAAASRQVKTPPGPAGAVKARGSTPSNRTRSRVVEARVVGVQGEEEQDGEDLRGVARAPLRGPRAAASLHRQLRRAPPLHRRSRARGGHAL